MPTQCVRHYPKFNNNSNIDDVSERSMNRTRKPLVTCDGKRMENQERDDEDDERERKAIIKRKCRMLNVFQTAKICMWRGEVKGKTMQMKHESVRSPAYAVAASAPPLLDASFVFGIVCSAVQ